MKPARALLCLLLPVAIPAFADEGVYLGGSWGESLIETRFDDYFDFDDDDTAWSVFAGVQANDWFGVEASYNDLGRYDESAVIDLTETSIDAELTSYDVMAVLSLPAGPLRVFGKAGVVFWDADVLAQVNPPVGPGLQVRDDDSGNDLGLGAGLELALSDSLALRAEYEWFDIDNTDKVWFGSVGISVRF